MESCAGVSLAGLAPIRRITNLISKQSDLRPLHILRGNIQICLATATGLNIEEGVVVVITENGSPFFSLISISFILLYEVLLLSQTIVQYQFCWVRTVYIE